VVLKTITKVVNQKVTKQQKCISSFFFFFRQASSNLHDFHDGFRIKPQHLSLSSAPAHRFFPGLKSHKVIQTAY